MAQAVAIGGARSNFGAKLFACLLLVGVADFLFFGQRIGWTLGLFALLILAAAIGSNPRLVAHRHGMVLAALCAGLGLAMMETDNPLAFVLFGLFFCALLSDVRMAGSFFSYICRQFLLAGHMAGYAILKDSHACRRYRLRVQAQRPIDRLRQLFGNWLLPLGLAALFLVLFAAANPVIDQWLIRLERWLILFEPQAISSFPSLGRIIFWIICTTVFWGVLRSNKLRIRARPERSPAPGASSGFSDCLFSRQAVLRALAIANILFLLQNLLDASYLWGGATLPAGLTYAQYAHRGAYALIVTALLAAAFVLIALRENSETAGDSSIRALIHLWLLQNMVLVFAAIWRTQLYVAEYSLTYLRLSALLWMGLILLGLILIVAKMVKEKSTDWLIRANLAAALTLLYACCFVDMGRFIASHNVAQAPSLEIGSSKIDLNYLAKIGPSALPALLRWRQELDAKEKAIPVALQVAIQRLQRDLAASVQDWRQWTFRNYRLFQDLYEPPSPNRRDSFTQFWHDQRYGAVGGLSRNGTNDYRVGTGSEPR